MCLLDANVMLVCELFNSQIRCVLQDGQKLKVSTATELIVYEMPRTMRMSTTELGGGGVIGTNGVIAGSATCGMTIENGLKDIQRNPG